MQLLTNHIGYLQGYPIRAVLQSKTKFDSGLFKIFDTHDQLIFTGQYSSGKRIEEWHTGLCSELILDDLPAGEYVIEIVTSRKKIKVLDTENYEHWVQLYTSYFTAQRSKGEVDRKDKHTNIIDQPDKTVDLSGGWYDASGDTSKYFSHLSVANFMNPQQIPLVVYSLLSSIPLQKKKLASALLDEALFGLDFLRRSQDEQGYFYTNVFDNWSKKLDIREVCAFSTQEGYRNNRYQAAFREGAGVAIAALAKASSYDHSFLKIAEKGYQHLIEHNLGYCEDGKANFIDYYTALLASVELLRAKSALVDESSVLFWIERVADCQTRDEDFCGYWQSRESLDRPFTHSSDEGLPIIALLEAHQCIQDNIAKEKIRNTCQRWFEYLLNVSQKTYNPFHYPRHYSKPIGHPKTDSFFFPHANETGYWWQGENARLGSLSSAIFYYLNIYPDAFRQKELLELATSMRNWLLGLNPFDLTMVYGEGHNSEKLDKGHAFPNTIGGICNGITASLYTPFDIAMMESDHERQFWRWSEQWLPHTSWWLLAINKQQLFEKGREL